MYLFVESNALRTTKSESGKAATRTELMYPGLCNDDTKINNDAIHARSSDSGNNRERNLNAPSPLKFSKLGIASCIYLLFTLPFVYSPYLSSLRTFLSSAATASPTSTVLDVPPISFVLIPASMTRRTASSTAFDSAGRRSEY